jgi:hypothetical protein
MAEFSNPEALVAAIRALRADGYRRLDAYLPLPDRAVEEALALPKSPLAWFVLGGGLLGAAIAYLGMWWTNAVDYPLNVGSRPAHAMPAFVPITFELTVLFAGLAAFFGWAWLCRLPRLWHPVFEVEGFERASVDGYFLAVDARDAHFVADVSMRRLAGLGALRVLRVGDGEREAHA